MRVDIDLTDMRRTSHIWADNLVVEGNYSVYVSGLVNGKHVGHNLVGSTVFTDNISVYALRAKVCEFVLDLLKGWGMTIINNDEFVEQLNDHIWSACDIGEKNSLIVKSSGDRSRPGWAWEAFSFERISNKEAEITEEPYVTEKKLYVLDFGWEGGFCVLAHTKQEAWSIVSERLPSRGTLRRECYKPEDLKVVESGVYMFIGDL